MAGLEAGADDYLIKPFDVNELRARVRAGKRILELQGALMKAHTELQFEAVHDHLTGLWNRGAIMDLRQRETQRSVRIGAALGVIMADLDHFKHINDSYGHQIGNTGLPEVAHRLLQSVRNYDCVGCYGGEEFLIVTAERMRAYVSEKPVNTDAGPIPVTISIGLAAQHAAGPERPRERNWCVPPIPRSIAPRRMAGTAWNAPREQAQSVKRKPESSNNRWHAGGQLLARKCYSQVRPTGFIFMGEQFWGRAARASGDSQESGRPFNFRTNI